MQEQLAILRQKIARIDERFKGPAPSSPNGPAQPKPPAYSEELRPARYFVEEWLSGEVVETRCGTHYETERLYERHRRHGSMDIGSLAELPHDLLDEVSNQEITCCPPERWAFLDTETTGLAGGTGTYAFLVGVGRITPAGFAVRQFFMRDHGEEASLLFALSEHLKQFDVLITYNGKAYDQPLLETRYRLCRTKPPFTDLRHFDLLFSARRLWKLRVENCRLVNLEQRILGVERVGDLPGDMIPYVYFEYLRKKEAFRVAPIFHHNAMDILSLGCLTGIVPWAFRSPADAPFTHGADMVGIARWLKTSGKHDHALEMLRKAVSKGLSDSLLSRTLWDIALLEKRRKQPELAAEAWRELSTFRNAYQRQAMEELAKYLEHVEKDHHAALEMTHQAMEGRNCPKLQKRAQRLERKLARKPIRRLI